MAELNALDQLFLELINRARMDPAGEAARFGLVDINSGLAAGTISAAPKQVLAPNTQLADAARSHSDWMLDVDVFSHAGSGGSTPGQRVVVAGYALTGAWTWAENIAWSGSTGSVDTNAAVFAQHESLFLSAGHRSNMLAEAIREAGVGTSGGQFTPGLPDTNTYNALMTTQDFARSGTNIFVSGVTYNDTDGDNFYSVGEGVGARTFELLSGGTVSGSTTSMAAGGYAIGAGAGNYELHVTGSGLAADIGASFALGALNVKIDLTDNNTIEANTSITLTRSTTNLALLGSENILGVGNGLSNQITGNSGNNYLYTGNGNDTAQGGAGIDVLLGDSGNDELHGGNDTDYLYGGTGANVLLGDAGVDVLYAQGTGDTLIGGEDGDYLYAFPGAIAPVGYGGNGNDIYTDLSGSGANDSFSGEAGQDYFYGFGGNDTFAGGAGVDVFLGGDGADSFEGGADVDYAFGGAGNDVFLVRPGGTSEVIVDFTAGAAEDRIQLADSALTTFGAVLAATAYFDNLNTSIITLGDGSNIWLIGVHPGSLTEADFTYG